MKFAVLTSSKRYLLEIQDCFRADGVECYGFEDVPSLLKFSRDSNFDLALVDAQSFRNTGQELMLWRACHSDHLLRVVVFGPFLDRESMFRAFDAGVSDILVGIFDRDEMYVRIHRILNPPGSEQGDRLSILRVGAYVLDKKQSRATFRDEPIYLTAREFSIAWLFFSNPNTFFTKQRLASSIWGRSSDCIDRTIEQHIYKLRRKLLMSKASNIRLQTLYSLGYKLDVGDSLNDAHSQDWSVPTRRVESTKVAQC
jgi:DNA-binding response OmpR family regulator